MSDNNEISTTSLPEKNKPGKRRGLKIALISLGSLLGLVVIVLCVACWLIFTPSRLTGIVNKLSDRFLTCESHFEKVDLTLFKTFPNVGLDVHNVQLINSVEGAVSDTLASIGDVAVGLNLRAFLKERNIIVKQVNINDVDANIYIDSLGNNNFSVFRSDTATKKEDTTSSSLPSTISVEKVKVNHLNATYQDKQGKMSARVVDLNLKVNGGRKEQIINAVLSVDAGKVDLRMQDSTGAESLCALLDRLDVKLKADGAMDDLNGNLKLALPEGNIAMAGTQYVNDAMKAEKKALLKIDAPFHADLDNQRFSLQDATVALTKFVLNITGDVVLGKKDTLLGIDKPMKVDACVKTDSKWPVKELISILPARFTSWSEGMDVDALLALEATAKGEVGDSVMPLITANLLLSDGTFRSARMLPYAVTKINGNLDATLDISQKNARPSVVKINSLTAKAAHSNVTLTGNVSDLLNDFLADVRLQGKISLPDVKPFLPETMPLVADGDAKLDIRMKSKLSQLQHADLKHMLVDGTIDLKELYVVYDSITAQSPAMRVALKIDPKVKQRLPHQLLQAKVTGGSLKANVLSSNIDADMKDIKLDAVVSDIMDKNVPLAVCCDFDFGNLEGKLDSLFARIAEPTGSFTMQPNAKDPAKVKYNIRYSSRSIHVDLNDSTSMDVAGLTVNGVANYDSTRSNVLAKWSPDFDVDFKLGYLHAAQLPYVLQIPDIKFNYKPEKCDIQSANIVFGNSDYYLSGTVTGLEQWLSHEAMLKGDLNFTSNFTNVDDLLDVFSGMGTSEDTIVQQRKEDKVPKEANPFIVPKDVDFILHTRIKDALAFENDLHELAGDVRVKDGVAVLDQVGFTCKAARMQLTAMYKTPRVNHLFCGLDFHLLDISISELIDMIPMVDTLVPMLSSFDGHANFHLAAETYLNAFYKPKMSTLRGAANINGDSLVVLDNETFKTISKYLLFKDKKRNVIDSLDVEMTVFRNEVQIYPFLLTMDRYQVCAAGRHNLDNSYDYHLEILKSPLPTRLALDVKGVMPKLNFKLGKCRYADMYKPDKRNDVQQKTLELKDLIRKSLESNVRQSTKDYQGLE